MSILSSTRNLIHDTAQGLLDADVTTKLTAMYASLFTMGLGLANDTLKIVRDVTTPPPPPAPPGP